MSRKTTREMIVIFLFQMDIRQEGYRDLMKDFIEDNPMKVEDLAFFTHNVEGVVERLEQIDRMIEERLVNWTIGRIPRISLAVLRNAVYEILFSDDIPVSVSINEAVEIAKKYGDADAGIFVNGILGKLARELNVNR
jgi:N utilization substance protein B